MASSSNPNGLNYNMDNGSLGQSAPTATGQPTATSSTGYDPITAGMPLASYRSDSLNGLQMAPQNLYYPSYPHSLQQSSISGQVTNTSQGSSMLYNNNPTMPAVSYTQYDRFMSHARPSVNSNPYQQYSVPSSYLSAAGGSSSGVSQNSIHGIPKLNPVSAPGNPDLNALYSAGISRLTANPDGPRKQSVDEMLYNASEFVRKMYNLISDPAEHQYIRWASNGDSFIIINQNDFAREILPRFFKHCNYSSFVRQLNKYGFHKIRNSPETKDLSSSAWEFYHAYFRRDYPQYLVNVKRKNDKISSSSAPASVPTSVATMSFPQVIKQSPVMLSDPQPIMITNSSAAVSVPDVEPEQESSSYAEPNIMVESLQNEVTALSENQKCLEETVYDLSKKLSFVYEELIRVKTTLAAHEARLEHPATGEHHSQITSTIYGNELQQQEETVALNQDVDRSLKHRLSHDNLDMTDKKMRVGDDGLPKLHTVVPEWTQPPRVLLVEDDPTCRSVSTKLLQIFGCENDTCSDGATAIKKMSSDSYDLVLMDIVMPTMDGVSATNLIRQFDPVTPIISMTSNLTEKDCMTYLSSGMTDILAKPFSKANLYEILIRYCGHLCKNSATGKPKETPQKSRDSNYMQMVNYSPTLFTEEQNNKNINDSHAPAGQETTCQIVANEVSQ